MQGEPLPQSDGRGDPRRPAEDGGLPFWAASAGIAALVGEGTAPNSRAPLEEVGIYAGGHRKRQVQAFLVGQN